MILHVPDCFVRSWQASVAMLHPVAGRTHAMRDAGRSSSSILRALYQIRVLNNSFFSLRTRESYSVLLGLSVCKSTFPHEAGVLLEQTVGIGPKAKTPDTLRILQDFPYVMLSWFYTTRHQKHQRHQRHQSKMKSSWHSLSTLIFCSSSLCHGLCEGKILGWCGSRHGRLSGYTGCSSTRRSHFLRIPRIGTVSISTCDRAVYCDGRILRDGS